MATSERPTIRMHVDSIFRAEIARLPWHLPLRAWESHGVPTLHIKRGISRHVVTFVRSGRFAFGIKEISESASVREVRNYEELLLRGIHTLVPVGYVVREERPIEVSTPVGIQFESADVSHTVTLLLDRVIPDSQLYRRAFTLENRKRIWDSIAELFVELHSHGVYWGDASLANTLVRFDKEPIPLIGKKTVLKSYLADAETVEIKGMISPALREADISFFFESMQWIAEDLRVSGIVRGDVATEEDQRYLRQRYDLLMAVEEKKKDFERRTSFSIDRALGRIPEPSYVDRFLKHIEEHRWYLGERKRRAVPLAEATEHWYAYEFRPLLELFRREGMLEHFPGKTAAELYIEIMLNKYFLSEEKGKDVGMRQAMRDYAQRFGAAQPMNDMIRKMSRRLTSLFPPRRPR